MLPEAFLTGYDIDVFAGPLPSLVDLPLEPIRDAARETGAVVVVGSALAAEGVATLSSIVVGPDGSVDVPYDKQHLDGDERRFFTAGDHGASIRVRGVELGLSICYDGCFPEHARAAAADGAAGYLNSRGVLHRRRAPPRSLLPRPRRRERALRRPRRPHGPMRVQRVQRWLRDLRPRGPAAGTARHRPRRRRRRPRHRGGRRLPGPAHHARRPPRRPRVARPPLSRTLQVSPVDRGILNMSATASRQFAAYVGRPSVGSGGFGPNCRGW